MDVTESEKQILKLIKRGAACLTCLHLLYVLNGYFYLHFMIILTIRFEDCMLKRLQAINLTKNQSNLSLRFLPKLKNTLNIDQTCKH